MIRSPHPLRFYWWALASVMQVVARPTNAAAPESDRVLVEICEPAILSHGEWPAASVATATESYHLEAFGLFELPHRYIATGVRADRANPSLVRASARITLSAGKHRILLRSRGAARLSIDGRVVLETPFDQLRTFPLANSGELPVAEQDGALDFGPGFRRAPPGNRDRWATVEFSGAPVVVVLETLLGGVEPKSKRKFRPELGETVVAVSLEGSSIWSLLSLDSKEIRYDDAGWAVYESEQRTQLDASNAAARATRRAENAVYWNRRRAVAREWLAATPAIEVPKLPAGFPAHNAIDHFLGARIAHVSAEYAPQAKKGDVDFYRDIQSIFEAHCYSCHQGSKVKGGLRLDQRAEALLGGNADGPAIVPHKPSESAIIARITSSDPDEVMPAKGDRLPEREVALLRRWVEEGASWPDLPSTSTTLTPLADDLVFLRRVTLDTVGVVPTEAEIATFQRDSIRNPQTAIRDLIDRLLADPRWADHQMGYWLDVLAENPNLLVPTLNNTGPFRWWLYESFLDNKPFDLLVTELVRMEGSERFGGPAGFGVASQNDVPMAAKGIILSSAFLGVEMKCARCHDAPTHAAKQKDLFQIAAMLQTKPLKVPTTSSVPLDHLSAGGRQPLIEVTLHPGETVAPAWPFAAFCDTQTIANIAEHPASSRDQLAASITAPQNERFAQVIVNRMWERLMGRGIVPTVGDWEKSTASHPELLRWLAREFVRDGYNLKALTRSILTSHAYRRAADVATAETNPLFAARAPRRMAAEQLIDSYFVATGKPFALEAVNFDIDSVRTLDNALDLGTARRAWMLASTSNERDRPSLMLPRIQAVAEVMEVFGWRGARPDASSGVRETAPNVLQPALLSNGTLMTWLTRLSDDHGLTRIALEDQSVETLVDRLFLRFFTRQPSTEEREFYTNALRPGYETRRVSKPAVAAPPTPERQKYVGWSNHMTAEANNLRLEEEVVSRRGDPPTTRLEPEWRERCENVIWALLNAPEWTHVL